MKAPKLKFSLPKISLPKISLGKLALLKFSRRKTTPAETIDDDATEVEPDAEAESDVAPAKRKFGLPRLQGKARLIVPAAAVVLLVGGGGAATYFLKSRPPAKAPAELAEAERPQREAPKAEAPEGKPAEGASQHPKPETAEAKHEADKPTAEKPAEAHAEAAKEGGHGGESGEGGEGGHGKKAKEGVAAAPLPLPPPPSEIEKQVRHLQELQDHVAAGDGVAFAAMPKALRSLARLINAAPPETWERPENGRALIVYLLSGGSAAVGRNALAAPKFSAAEAVIAKAAAAYLENAEGPERDAMLTFDPRALDPTLGAQIAFVQSILLTSGDRAAAIAKLDLTRLLAPGGLVEEAALRREVSLLAESRDYERFASLARQYWSRFRPSPYADNFLRQFMLGVARVSLSIKLEQWRQLDGFIESLSDETKRNIYLTVAQTASMVGNFDLGAMAAARARDLSAEGSAERQRAIVYGGAATVGAAPEQDSAHLLDGVAREQLPPGDQPIYDAVAFVSGRIFRAPEKAFKAPPPGEANEADGRMAQAEKLLQQGDEVIASVRKTMERKNP